MINQDFKLVFEEGDLDIRVLDSLEDCADMVLDENGGYDARELARDYNRATPFYKMAMNEGRMSAYSKAMEALVAQGYPPDSGMSPAGWADYKDVMDGLMDLDDMSMDGWIGYCNHWGDTWNEDYDQALNDYFDWEFDRLWPEGKVGPEINPEQASFLFKAHILASTDRENVREGLSLDKWSKLAPAYWNLKDSGYMIEDPQIIVNNIKFLKDYDQTVQKIKPPSVDKEATIFNNNFYDFDESGDLSLEEIDEIFRIPPSDEFEL